MSIFSFYQKSAPKIRLVLDIGSKTVGGGLFETPLGENPKLLYSVREPIAFQKVLTGENLFAAMLRSLERVLVQLKKRGVEFPSQTGVPRYRIETAEGVVSSPWHISEIKTLKTASPTPFPVREELVIDMLSKEAEKFEAQFPGGDSGNSDLDILERKIIEMRLNGYPTARPYDKKTRELQLRVFTSIAPKRVSEKIRRLVCRYFPLERVSFHTFSLLAFASIRDLFSDTDDFIIVQVGGEVTDISVVKSGIIAETLSLPLGHNNLSRSLSRICRNHPHCVLETLLNLHREAKAASEDKKKVDRAITELKSSWLELFNGALSSFYAASFLPQTVFLFEENLYGSLFEDFIRESAASRFTVNAKPFIVKTGHELEGVLTGSKGIISADAILDMEAHFLAQLSE